LLLRYGASHNGDIEKKAVIYTRDEHHIRPGLIDADALWVIKRLREAGNSAYVVGGAVRDLLTHRKPKDFDIATDAHPQRVKRILRNSRIVGRRFRIVHVLFGRNKVIEVSTFRSRREGDSNNTYGTMGEDAWRRDFSFNALYYCPTEGHLIDYVGGFEDIAAGRMRTLAPCEESFHEDPVRMIRAVKYASLTGFRLPASMSGLIRRFAGEIRSCSMERLTEEVYKILCTGKSEEILTEFLRLRLLEVILPAVDTSIKKSHTRFPESRFAKRLSRLDSRTREGGLLERDRMFEFLFEDLVRERIPHLRPPEATYEIQDCIRSMAPPLFPSRKDLLTAGEMLREGGRRHS
jgi:poly(A) polymerase